MVNVEAQEQNVVQGFVDLVLQAGLVVGRVSAAQEAQGLHLLVSLLQDADAPERDPEIGRELGWHDLVLLDDAKRATAVASDGIDFVPLHCRVENNRPAGIDMTERHRVRIATITRQRKHARCATAEDALTLFSG